MDIIKGKVSGFMDFIREQGVVGLAIGFVLGGAVSKTVTSLVDNIINPVVGLLMGKVNLTDRMTVIGNASIKWGAFISTIIDFISLLQSSTLALKCSASINSIKRKNKS